jgi:hypothetical protein
MPDNIEKAQEPARWDFYFFLSFQENLIKKNLIVKNSRLEVWLFLFFKVFSTQKYIKIIFFIS